MWMTGTLTTHPVSYTHLDVYKRQGIHDIDTMNQLREELLKIDPTIFVYGEGWVAADSPLPFEQRAVKENVRKMKGISVFNDEFRDLSLIHI